MKLRDREDVDLITANDEDLGVPVKRRKLKKEKNKDFNRNSDSVSHGKKERRKQKAKKQKAETNNKIWGKYVNGINENDKDIDENPDNKNKDIDENPDNEISKRRKKMKTKKLKYLNDDECETDLKTDSVKEDISKNKEEIKNNETGI